MKKRLIYALVFVNASLAFALATWPLTSQLLPDPMLTDCCKDDGEEPFCCHDCCLFINDCTDDDDCN